MASNEIMKVWAEVCTKLPDEYLSAWRTAYKQLPRNKRTWSAAWNGIPDDLKSKRDIYTKRICLAFDMLEAQQQK